MKLHIADNLNLPIDAATQTFAFIGRKGSGKTYGAGKLAELLIGAGVQTIILDLVGKWWGLRLAKDGHSPGIDIPMLGGLRGDIPLEAAGGALIADALLESGRSAILDISQFSKSGRQEFAFKFGERLWQGQKGQLNPTPVHLIIEESQLIVPENIPAGRKQDFMTQMYGMFEEIIRLGRNYGIGVTMITQRPQSVAKEVLNQAEPLLVFQTIGSHERKAVRDWIRHQGMDEGLTDSLPALKKGQCWFWSPEWLEKLEQVQIAEKWTFDSTATPKVGEKHHKARSIKPIDLADLQAKMKATIERAKADDPRELRKEIARLKSQIAQPQQVVKHETKEVRVEVPILKDSQIKRLESLADRLDGQAKDILDRATRIGLVETAKLFSDQAEVVRSAIRHTKSQADQMRSPAYQPICAETTRGVRATRQVVAMTEDNGESAHATAGVRQSILDALAELEAIGVQSPPRVQVAFMAGYSNTRSTGFAKAVSSLSADSLIAYPDSKRMKFTDSGRRQAKRVDEPPTTETLHKRVCDLLGGVRADLLGVLIREYPNAVARDDLAIRCKYTNVRSTGFAKSLSSLSGLGFVDYPDSQSAIASEILFPIGVR